MNIFNFVSNLVQNIYPFWIKLPGLRNATIRISASSPDILTYGWKNGRAYVRFTGFTFEEGSDGTTIKLLAKVYNMMINHNC